MQRLLVTLSLAWILGASAGICGDDDTRKTVSARAEADQIIFQLRGDVVCRYHKSPDAAKPYLWPILGPGAVALTRAWPMEKGTTGESTDHVHQRSVWFCHGDVIPEGIELTQKIKGVDGVDFWSEHMGHGVIRCVVVDEPTTTRERCSVVTKNEWLTSDGRKILDEKRTISLHDLGAARLVVVDIALHAVVCPITFGDTKEGSFGVRVHDAIRVQKGNGRIENADGKVGEGPCWGQKSVWCDYSGTIDGKAVGIAVFDHPRNPHPACWHVRGYGLMAANPFGRAKSGFPAMKGRTDVVKLAKGDHLNLRYGLLLHAGDAKGGNVAEHYQTFTRLPLNASGR